MSLDYSIGQQQSISTQRVDLAAPRNPAEELIFQRTNVAEMIESSDGSIHYLDSNGEPVAVMNPDGSVYMWEAGGWKSYSIDDVLAAFSHDEPLQQSQSIAAEEVVLDDEVEYSEMVCEPTSGVFSEDAMMSIADEDRYCDAETMQCRMPDEDHATERHAQRFAESAPTSSSSSSEAAAKKKSSSEESTEVADAGSAEKEENVEVGTVDYSDEVSGTPSNDSEGDVEAFAVGGGEADTTSVDDGASSSDITETIPLGDTTQDFIAMSDVDAPDISAMVYTRGDGMTTSDHSTTMIGGGAFGGTMKGGIPEHLESGALSMFGYPFDSIADEIFGGMFYRAIVSSDKPSITDGIDVDADSNGVEYSALVMLGDRFAKSEPRVASRAVRGGLRITGSSRKGRGTSPKLNSQLVLDGDPFSVAYTTSGMGGTPHMSSIPGVLGMAGMALNKESEQKVVATLEGGDRHRDNPEEQNRDDNSEQHAELFEESEDGMLVS